MADTQAADELLRAQIREAVTAATSLEEVQRLERMLHDGTFQGEAAAAGTCDTKDEQTREDEAAKDTKGDEDAGDQAAGSSDEDADDSDSDADDDASESSESDGEKDDESDQASSEVEPAAMDAPLIGSRIEVWWADDAAWYAAIVLSFDHATMEHSLRYLPHTRTSHAVHRCPTPRNALSPFASQCPMPYASHSAPLP